MLQSRMHIRLLIALSLFTPFIQAYEHGDSVPADFTMPKPLTLAESQKTFTTKPGLRIELIAAEPMTMDPVAIDFGADGKLWVVEMADYPLGLDGQNKPGGRVRFLTDSNGDGKFDQSTLFLDDLNFPTGVKAWRNGVIIVAAPEIFYAEDTTGDGVADTREVLFRGFKEGNQQHRVNGLVWGLDHFLHLANGDSGGQVTSLKTGETLDIGSFDLKIQPDTGAMAKTSGRTQYGRVRDDFGNWFGCSNSKPLFQFALKQENLAQNPHVVYPSASVSITDPVWAPEVFPSSKPALRYNDPQAANRFTSACGLTIYRDQSLGDDYYGNALICEPVHNLVHRRVLTRPDGELIFKAERAADETNREFLTSTDPWFRPVQTTTGPDGALWIVDMHRFVIEHPEWIPEEWQKVLDLRAGSDRGRIYRVVSDSCGPAAFGKITVAMADSPNGRIRDMADQISFEQGLIADQTGSDRNSNSIKQGLIDEATLSDREASPYAVANLLSSVIPVLETTVKSLPENASPLLISGLFETAIGTGKLELTADLLGASQERYAILLSVLDRRKLSLADFEQKLSPAGKAVLAKCATFAGAARETVSNSDAELATRIAAVGLLGRNPENRAGDIGILGNLITPATPAELASAAVRRLREMSDFGFIEKLSQARPAVRKTILEAALSDPKGAGVLLKNINDGEFTPNLVDTASRSRLMSFPNGDIRKQARALFESAVNGDRAAVIAKYAAALSLDGDFARGRAAFQAACAACHQLDGIGTADLGADLTALSDKSSGALLAAILDPNRAVEDKFLLYSVTLSNGSILAGMIQGEQGDTISLKALDGTMQELSRGQIAKLENTGRSAMPEGLEAAMDTQAIADVIAFLQKAGK